MESRGTTTARQSDVLDSNSNYKSKGSVVGGGGGDVQSDDYVHANDNDIDDGDNDESIVSNNNDNDDDTSSSSPRRPDTKTVLKGSGLGSSKDPTGPRRTAAEGKPGGTVTGCLRSPRSLDDKKGGSGANGVKRVTFDGHDLVDGCGDVTTARKKGVIVTENRLSTTTLTSGAQQPIAASGPEAGCSGRGAVAVMPKGSGATGNRSDHERKTGCFGCISRKNARSITADHTLIDRSAVLHYGSTGSQPAINKRASSNSHLNAAATTDQHLLSDARHAVTSENSISSGAEKDKESLKTRHGIQNTNHQLLASNCVETASNQDYAAVTRKQSPANVINQTCNDAFADKSIAAVEGCDTGTTTEDPIVTKCNSIPNGSTTVIQSRVEQRICGSLGGSLNDRTAPTSNCSQISTADGLFTLGSNQNNYQGDEEYIPSICDSSTIIPLSQLLIDLRAQNFDLIQFFAYRTACKLRFLQKTTLLHLVDIWNVMTTFRDHGLDMMEPFSEIPLSKVIAIINDLYESLKNRLPSVAQFSVEPCIAQLIDWLSNAYNGHATGRMQLISVQVVLSVLCAGHMSDKLLYIFGQLSISDGHVDMVHLQQYLCEILSLPVTVLEPSTPLTNSLSRECIDWCQKFSGSRSQDGPAGSLSSHVPQCLLWLPILHKLPRVENVVHSISCSVCQCCPVVGFRYECQKCENYSLCQLCFWSRQLSGSHSSDHNVKEFSAANSVTRNTKKRQQTLPSLLKIEQQSLCSADKTAATGSCSGPLQSVNEYCHSKASSVNCSPNLQMDMSGSPVSTLSRSKRSSDSMRVDDEHKLIARYVERLAIYPHSMFPLDASNMLSAGVEDAGEKHHLVAELEAKNREILREIQHLRMQQKTNRSDFNSQRSVYNPALAVELQLLRQRRDELETRMKTLQGSRRELMLQLETLMKMLKNPLTPWSTPTNSPRSRVLPPMIPGQNMSSGSNGLTDSVVAVSNDVRHAFAYDQSRIRPSTSSAGSGGGHVHYLKKDLFSATDSVTNAVSSLVKELNSEDSSDSEGDVFEPFRDHKFHHSMDKRRTRPQEFNFIPDIRVHKSSTSSGVGFVDLGESEGFVTADDCEPLNGTSQNGSSSQFALESSSRLYDKGPRELVHRKHLPADEESCLETDQESYIRTDDDDEGGNTEWEDAMKRWIHR